MLDSGQDEDDGFAGGGDGQDGAIAEVSENAKADNSELGWRMEVHSDDGWAFFDDSEGPPDSQSL